MLQFCIYDKVRNENAFWNDSLSGTISNEEFSTLRYKCRRNDIMKYSNLTLLCEDKTLNIMDPVFISWNANIKLRSCRWFQLMLDILCHIQTGRPCFFIICSQWAWPKFAKLFQISRFFHWLVYFQLWIRYSLISQAFPPVSGKNVFEIRG